MSPAFLHALCSAGSVFLAWNIAALALCLTGITLERILRRSNVYARSMLLRLTLLLSLAVPLAGSTWRFLPEPPSSFASAPSTPETALIPRPTPGAGLNRMALWRPLVSRLENESTQVATRIHDSLAPGTAGLVAFLGLSWLLSIHLAGRLLFAFRRGAELRRQGKRMAPEDEARCSQIALVLRVNAPPVLRVGQLQSPVLLGVWRPAVLLPPDLPVCDEIFFHELTHLRRHDIRWHFLAVLATVLMPLQPGFGWLKKALEQADEDVCDDTVLAQGADAGAYANLLLNVVESQHALIPHLCLPMAASCSQLERRLRRLLDATRPLARRLSVPALLAGFGPLTAVGIVAGAILIDTQRTTAAADATQKNVLTAPASGASPLVDPPRSALAALQRELVDAQQDAAHRRVLYEQTRNLSDNDFIATLEGMGRLSPACEKLRIDIIDQQGAIKGLIKEGFMEGHPRVEALKAKLAVQQAALAKMVQGSRNALKIDSEMADAGVKVLQDEVSALEREKAAGSKP